jgi:hypothetical protein
MARNLWIGAMVLLLACGAFGLGHTFQTADQAVAGVDNTEYSLMVCFKNDGTPLYQGLVDNPHSAGGVFTFTEDNGLTRYITGATCVLTRGTTEQYSEAADQAAKAAGGVTNDAGSSDNAGDPVQADK